MPPPSTFTASTIKTGLNTAFGKNIQRDPSQHFNMLLFGAPGVGKGTFAKLIKKDFNFKPFSTGDYFRSVIKLA